MWRYLRRQRDAHAAEGKASYEKAVQQQLEEEDEEEPLEEVSRRLISQEEELFSQESTSEREVDELQRDYEALQLQLWMAVNDTFTSSSSSSTSSSSSLGALRSAVLSVQQQEAQDQSWRGRGAEVRVPAWRPLRCLRTHNELLQKMVESRLAAAEEEEPGGAEGLSSPLKREVCCLGRRVKEDLLMVWRTVKDCYPASMDILNFYAALYHRTFSAHLTQVAVSGPASSDCGYILFWVNHYYPQEVLQHQELDGRIKTACLGSLLPQEHLEHLENQYLNHKEEKVKLWLTTALRKEEEGWLNGGTPELIDHYCFSPLAVDVIQLMDGCLSELRCVVRDQTEARRITFHLERFLSSYRKCVEEMAKRDGSSVRQGLKAHLVCEWQLREYVTAQTGSAMSGQQRARCLDTMAALRDCGYKCLSMAIHLHLKRCFCQVWTSRWLDGSLPVIDSLLDFLNQQLSDWTDLQPACRESLLSRLQQDVVLRYVKRVMKTGPKGEKQQVDGARRMIEDAQKINDFFSEGGCTGSLWLGEMLCQLAEVLRLQDPGSVQLEMVSVANTFSDLSDAHVSALLSLKSTLSGADVRAIRRSVAENRLPAGSANQGPPFFSMVKVKWVHNKLTQIGLRRGMVLVGP